MFAARGIVSLVFQVVSNTNLKLWCDAQLAVVQNCFMWLTAVLPYLVVAERYFAGEIEFGVISQVTFCVYWDSAVALVLSALG